MLEHGDTGLALRARIEQWRRFAEWEAEDSRGVPRSLATDLEWFSDGLAFADQLDPGANDLDRVRAKAERIARLRHALAGVRRGAL
jgi:hypothetical protein